MTPDKPISDNSPALGFVLLLGRLYIPIGCSLMFLLFLVRRLCTIHYSILLFYLVLFMNIGLRLDDCRVVSKHHIVTFSVLTDPMALDLTLSDGTSLLIYRQASTLTDLASGTSLVVPDNEYHRIHREVLAYFGLSTLDN